MTASIWTPGSNNIPAVDPRSQLKSETFVATEGQTSFLITEFTYTTNNGALTVYVNRAKLPGYEVSEDSSTSFSVPPCEAGDLVEVVGNTAIQDAEGAAATAQAAAAAALASELAAASSETNAANSEANAANSEALAIAAAAEAALYVPLDWKGAWLTATPYIINDAVKQAGSSYICLEAHTSGVFADDLVAAKWDLIAEKGAAGAGTGDMLAANNLSDVADAATARNNLGLGTAATTAASDYATAAQGAKADSAVQPAAIANMLETDDIGSLVQGYDADTAKLDVAQTYTASQKAALVAENDLSIDLSAAGNDYTATPTAGGTLSFSNIAGNAGKSGNIILTNSAAYAIAKGVNIKSSSSLFTTLSGTGDYWLSYHCDGTSVRLVSTGALV